jgi:inorganic pyrophosphatase
MTSRPGADKAIDTPFGGVVFPIVIDQPAGPFNVYRWLPKDETAELERVEAGVEVRPFEMGHLADAIDPDGRPLAALMPVRIPTFPGCRVMARAIARGSSDLGPMLIAVPAADSFFAAVHDLQSLPEPYRSAIIARCPGSTWGAASEAAQAAREGRRRLRLTRTESEKAARVSYAWRTGGPPKPGEPSEAEPYSIAEQAVPLLPLRFQEYIARELLDDERILMFIHRPAFTPPGARVSLRRRLPEGIFVLTDHQVMFMADALDPGRNFVAWGYVAQVTAVERIVGARALDERGASRLEITLAGDAGGRSLSLIFPGTDDLAVREAADLLNGFAAGSRGRQLRRLYDIGPTTESPAPEWAVLMAPGQEPLTWVETRAGGRMSVSPHAVSVQSAPGASVRTIDLANVTCLDLTLALTLRGCRLAVMGAEGSAGAALDFEYPQASEFLAAFTILRQLLGQPAGSTCHETANRAAK